MQFQVLITIEDAIDVFDVAKKLAPIADIPGVKMSAATPRPDTTPALEKHGLRVKEGPSGTTLSKAN